MHRLILFLLVGVLVGWNSLHGANELMQTHCSKCHNDEKSKGDFNLKDLGASPSDDNLDFWLDSLDYVVAGEMPPEDESELTDDERDRLIAYLESKVDSYGNTSQSAKRIPARRLNNREFANSLRDALLLDDIEVFQATSDLVGDSLYHGFDTHGETLGFSRFHLEQYLEAVRKVVDGVVMTGPRPETKKYRIEPNRIERAKKNQNDKRAPYRGDEKVFEFLGTETAALFSDFRDVPTSGKYRFNITCSAKGRTKYPTESSGLYEGDPTQLLIKLGDLEKTFDLPDEEVTNLQFEQWIAKGASIEMFNPTDGLKQIGNSNFKFQYRMMQTFLEKNDPEMYQKKLVEIKSLLSSKKAANKEPGSHWSHWALVWDGPKIDLYSAEIEGPVYESWPPKSHTRLVGDNPSVEKAAEILRPIAQRAWKRAVDVSEMDDLVALVEASAETMSEIEALKEGMISIFLSPSFLYMNPDELNAKQRYAAKLSYLIKSTAPDKSMRKLVRGKKLDSFEGVQSFLADSIKSGAADEFLEEFPYAWLELADINFMAPDPDNYRHYHRKEVSEDMIGEVRHFFRYALENNIPLPEFLSADYSFINADLAQVYEVDGIPQDSKFRKYTFSDGRRGGLLGMGAFLTVTADTLSTSPIHRAVYVMENFMGIHPTPPPADVEITEPDVREAKTIKEILAAHTEDENCASCHQTIDPWGYAFENFDPMGAWRESYKTTSDQKRSLVNQGRTKALIETVPIDSGAKFRNGNEYNDIIDYRKSILTTANRDRFVRCFISKVLLYGNGIEPDKTDFAEIEKILEKSAEHEYRVVDTIAAIIESSLFRE